MDLTEAIGDYNLTENKMSNIATNTTFLSLSLADFGLATDKLVAHDYIVAGGLAILGVIFVYFYHKFGNS